MDTEVNINKYFRLLESLDFGKEKTKTSNSHKEPLKCLEENVACLQKFFEEPLPYILQSTTKTLQIKNQVPLEISQNSLEQTYSIYMQYLLLEIVNEIDFNSESKENLISTRNINLCISALQSVAKYALRQNLNPNFYQKNIFDQPAPQPNDINCEILKIFIAFFDKVLEIKQFHVANSMELVIRDYMAAIFTLYLEENDQSFSENFKKELQAKLDAIWLRMSKLEYFRNVMLFKSLQNLRTPLQRKLHQELVQKLASKDGFVTFLAVLQTATQQRQENSNQQTHEIVANIVAFPGHTQRFQTTMIRQIFSFLQLCLRNEAMLDSMGTGLLTLRRLYDLNAENRKQITALLETLLKKFSQPEDVLSGLIAMEHNEFCQIISLLYQIFFTSSVACLPSELLVKYLPLMLELYYNLPDSLPQKQQLADIVSRCLNNRSVPELQTIVQKLYTRNFDEDWQQLHERLVIVPNMNQIEICLKIASAEYKPECSISLSLPSLLMQANHAILTYEVFMALLRLMASKVLAADESELDVDLLHSEEELITLLNAKYPVKIEIILSLNTLISYQPLKLQIAENSHEFLKFVRQLVDQRIQNLKHDQNMESTDQILLIMLTLTQELIEHTQLPEEHRDFIPILRRLRTETPNVLVQQRVDTLITFLSGELKSNAAQQDTPFNTARALLESHESHLQVYGIQMLLDLLRKRDAVTLANGHVIVALALTTLRNKESYTFLNCVRLFVALVNVMESEVLEILSDEYLNENGDTDFRLVVGEAILKISQELGPLCYKYKNVLINMFMYGARSPLDEFRMSAFSNLAQLCRTLCYQVLKFFEELLHLIDCELSTGKYLPAKRAAILVLSELLEGIDNLMDFEEILLPVYRLLKLIATTETCDDQMRTHATNGLKALSEKCKKFLFPEQALQKEIRIFGIKDESKGLGGKNHILELN